MLNHLESSLEAEDGLKSHEVLDLHQTPGRLEVGLAEHDHDWKRGRVAGEHVVQDVDQVDGGRPDALGTAGVDNEQDGRGAAFLHIRAPNWSHATPNLKQQKKVKNCPPLFKYITQLGQPEINKYGVDKLVQYLSNDDNFLGGGNTTHSGWGAGASFAFDWFDG